MPKICVTFSDSKEKIESNCDSIRVHYDHVSAMNVRTYVNFFTPGIENTGCDMDGDVIYNKEGKIYFDAVDKIEINNDGETVTLFEKHYP